MVPCERAGEICGEMYRTLGIKGGTPPNRAQCKTAVPKVVPQCAILYYIVELGYRGESPALCGHFYPGFRRIAFLVVEIGGETCLGGVCAADSADIGVCPGARAGAGACVRPQTRLCAADFGPTKFSTSTRADFRRGRAG